jgi:hypothetical protein
VAFVVDSTRDRLAALVTERECVDVRKYEFSRLDRSIRANVPLSSSLVDGEEAFATLTAIREHLEIDVLHQAQRFSPFKWLWYLRRLPQIVFEGNLRSTFIYDSGLAACASARSQASSPYKVEDGFITYRVKSEPVQHTLRFCSAVRFLSQVHSNLRWAGKRGCCRVFRVRLR